MYLCINVKRLIKMCKCEEWKVIRKDRLCLNDRVVEVVHFKCRLCGKVAYSDELDKENDWEGLK